VLYVTERCVLQRTGEGVELTEVAPGIDIGRDILAHMDFRPIVRDPRPMDARLFRPEPMGMEQTLLGLSLAERISFDAERDTLFINYEGFQVRTTDDVELVRREVENHCRTIGHRIAVIVNYDGFTLDPVVSDAFFSMITYLQQRYYSSASRYTTSAFMRLKLGASLTERALAPHVFETLQEAHAFMTTQMPAPDRSNRAQKS
jgi:propionate CoA-transferase